MKNLLFAALAAALLIVCASTFVGRTFGASQEIPATSLTLDVEETGKPQGKRLPSAPSPQEGSLLPLPPAGDSLELDCNQSLCALLRDFSHKFNQDAADSVRPVSSLEVSGPFSEGQIFWLRQNASRYGWVLLDTQRLRYVGIPHAFLMRAKNFSLEQYLNYLRETGGVTVRLSGQVYAIGYIPPGEPPLAPEGEHAASGDGRGGVILTTLLT